MRYEPEDLDDMELARADAAAEQRDIKAGEEWDEEQEDYVSLCDEMNDPDVGPWNEADWDERAVANAKRYAQKNGLSWPPQTGDFDRWYESQQH